MHHILIVKSELQLANLLPSVIKLILLMQAVCPLKVFIIFPLSISHNFIVASSEQEAIIEYVG